MENAKEIIIIHNDVGETPTKENEDTLVQVNEVFSSLEELGYAVSKLSVKDFSDLEKLKDFKGYVFNLVEDIDGSGKLLHLVPKILEDYGLEFSGCGSYAMEMSNSKVNCKKILLRNNIPTGGFVAECNTEYFVEGTKYILKPIHECASVGISTDGIFVAESLPQVLDKIKEFESKNGYTYFADEFIDGREISVSMIHGRTLPPREMMFLNFGDKPKILSYKAKWDLESEDYDNTESREVDLLEETELVIEINRICVECWKILKLSGYARIDFRVDNTGKPHVMEINANPCITTDSSLDLSCQKVGISQNDKVSLLINSSLDKPFRKTIITVSEKDGLSVKEN
ncbi:MAG: hypothetical protein FWD89_03860 [Firmicutes bacterium]|nr:hypothetical protein [Bacillota bacterium]